MTETLMNRIKAQLVRHKGLRLQPYLFTAGKLTIGIGYNLDDQGISQKEVYAMLKMDIQDFGQWLVVEIPDVYKKLSEVLQLVLMNMCTSITQSRFAPYMEPCYLGNKGLLELKNTLVFFGPEPTPMRFILIL